jgi:hypothetical protein
MLGPNLVCLLLRSNHLLFYQGNLDRSFTSELMMEITRKKTQLIYARSSFA